MQTNWQARSVRAYRPPQISFRASVPRPWSRRSSQQASHHQNTARRARRFRPYQLRRRAPIRAQAAVTRAIAAPYQVTKNTGLSWVQNSE